MKIQQSQFASFGSSISIIPVRLNFSGDSQSKLVRDRQDFIN